jgi:NAD(P)-dependent dehydrogenase (short-subunit alcohol dehydrogenase family)
MKRYLFTGSSGIAESAIRLASRAGDAVFVIGNIEEQCTTLCSQLPNAAFAVADITRPEEVANAVEMAFQQMGGVDGAFNVAGMSGRSLGDGPVHECTNAAWEQMMAVHAGGSFYLTRELLSRWLSQETGGAIVHMSSILANHPEPEHFATHAYAASKGAVEALTRTTASYYARYGVRINAVAPSVVRTPMSRRAQSNTMICELLKRKQPLTGDFLEPENVASLALFLLSDAASSITGQVIAIDAGWSVSG